MNKLLISVALICTSQITLALTNRSGVGPDRETASAAVIMKSDGMLKGDQTIPSNVIDKSDNVEPVNTIFEGTPVDMIAPIPTETITK